MTVDVYSKPACVACDATYRAMNKAGIKYNTFNVIEDHEAGDFARSLGYQELPVVVAGEEHWSGFRPERIRNLV